MHCQKRVGDDKTLASALKACRPSEAATALVAARRIASIEASHSLTNQRRIPFWIHVHSKSAEVYHEVD